MPEIPSDDDPNPDIPSEDDDPDIPSDDEPGDNN